jgi:hypothetical protein
VSEKQFYFAVNGSHGVGKTETLQELRRIFPSALYLEEPLNPNLGSLSGEEELIRQHRERSARIGTRLTFADRSGYLDIWAYTRVMQEEYGWPDGKVQPTLEELCRTVSRGEIAIPTAEIILVSTVEENKRRILERIAKGARDSDVAKSWKEDDSRRLELTDKYFRVASGLPELPCGRGRIALPPIYTIDVTESPQVEVARKIAALLASNYALKPQN